MHTFWFCDKFGSHEPIETVEIKTVGEVLGQSPRKIIQNVRGAARLGVETVRRLCVSGQDRVERMPKVQHTKE